MIIRRGGNAVYIRLSGQDKLGHRSSHNDLFQRTAEQESQLLHVDALECVVEGLCRSVPQSHYQQIILVVEENHGAGLYQAKLRLPKTPLFLFSRMAFCGVHQDSAAATWFRIASTSDVVRWPAVS